MLVLVNFILMVKKYLLLISTFLLFESITAQTIFPYRVTHYTTEDGLAHNSGNCFVQDEFGFIWIGSFGGLERFDGYGFRIYQSNKVDTNSLSNSRITALYIDENQTIWIGTSEGLNSYLRNKDQFIRYSSSDPWNSLSSDNISFIAPGSNGQLWIGTHGGGLNLFDPTSRTNKRFPVDSHAKNGLNSYDINAYVYDDRGQLWIGGLNGINIIDTSTHQIRDFYAVENDLGQFKGTVIRSLGKDGKGKVWIGTWLKGIYSYDTEQNQSELVPNIPSHLEPYEIIPVSDSEMVVATNKGLFFSNTTTFNSLNLRHNLLDRFSLTNNICTSLFKDRTGTLWIGTFNSGINKIDLYQKKFGLIKSDLPGYNNLTDNFINRFEEDWKGNIWICTRKGINKLDPRDSSLSAFHFLDKYNEDKVNTAVKGNYPHLWVGTDYGLVKFNTETGEHFRYEMGPNSLSNNVVNSLHYDSANQLLWTGTWGGGLDRFDLTKNAWRNFPIDEIFASNVVLTIREGDDGALWLGTSGKGLAKFNPETEKISFLKSTSGNVVISLMINSQGRIWAGTGTDGVYIIDPDTEKAINLKVENGLPSNEIAGILQNTESEYWLSSAKGLSRLSLQPDAIDSSGLISLNINHFDFKDGLQANAFNQEAALKSSSGRFFFGGSQGLNVFFPDSIALNPFLASPVITSFELMGKVLYPSDNYDERLILEKPIYCTKELTLEHHDKLIGLELSAMHFADPGKNKFAYKLENFHDQWIYTDASRRFISFSDLMPGRYLLKVRASNNDGVWSDDAEVLSINILPPWWLTGWFFILSSLLFVALLAGFIKYRTYKLKERQKLLEIIIKERTKEIFKQKNDILTQNEELAAMNDKISTQSTQLLSSHKRLELINKALKKARQELQASNENLDKTVKERTLELEKTVKELDHFVYVASHDLGAPLKSVLGLVNIIKLDHKEDGLHKKLSMIETSVVKLENVISSLKQFSRNNKREVKPESINLAEVVAEILDSMRFIDNFSRINFLIDIPDNLSIISDVSRAKSIVTNLFDNAIKYHNYGKKELYVRISAAIKWNHCFVSISDNGQGIDNNLLKNIFEMFYRANTDSDGSGLGLYIVRESITKLGGKIKVKSKLNEGTRFLILLPCDPSGS